MNKKPVIGVLSHRSQINHRDYAAIYFNYADSVFQAGGTPLLVIQLMDEDYIEHIVNTVDGILIPGGVDVHPKFYNEPIKRLCGEIDERLDAFEFLLIKKAREKKIPILGICRGLQVLNVALGGTLYQDIHYYPHLVEDVTHAQNHQGFAQHQAVHKIHIEKQSVLHSLYGNELDVNSYHHQFINRVGAGLRVTAQAPDGIIEAIEGDGDQFILGVQWHPEKMFEKHEEQLKIFTRFVQECSKSING